MMRFDCPDSGHSKSAASALALELAASPSGLNEIDMDDANAPLPQTTVPDPSSSAWRN
jgi:hypothetical protein